MNDTEKKENDQLKWHHYLIAILFVLVGAVFIVYKQIDIPMICKVFSVVFEDALCAVALADVRVGHELDRVPERIACGSA